MSRGWFHKGSALPMLRLCGCASAALSPSPDAQPVPGLPGDARADVAGVLVAANGHRYPALPPVRAGGEPFSPMLSMGFSPVGTPGFTHQRFTLAPYLAPLYSGVPVHRRRYLFCDPGYYALRRRIPCTTWES